MLVQTITFNDFHITNTTCHYHFCRLVFSLPLCCLCHSFPAGRRKYIHSVGNVGKVKFVAAEGSPYTGAFAGNDNVLIRFSSAKGLAPGSFTPGFGIKFMLDGRKSSNFVAMPVSLKNDPQYWLTCLHGCSDPQCFFSILCICRSRSENLCSKP